MIEISKNNEDQNFKNNSKYHNSFLCSFALCVFVGGKKSYTTSYSLAFRVLASFKDNSAQFLSTIYDCN